MVSYISHNAIKCNLKKTKKNKTGLSEKRKEMVQQETQAIGENCITLMGTLRYV